MSGCMVKRAAGGEITCRPNRQSDARKPIYGSRTYFCLSLLIACAGGQHNARVLAIEGHGSSVVEVKPRTNRPRIEAAQGYVDLAAM